MGDDFWKKIREAAQDPEYKKLREKVEKGLHPPEEHLVAYVRGLLDDDMTRKVMQHIAFCGICAGRALKLRVAEGKFDEDDEE